MMSYSQACCARVTEIQTVILPQIFACTNAVIVSSDGTIRSDSNIRNVPIGWHSQGRNWAWLADGEPRYSNRRSRSHSGYGTSAGPFVANEHLAGSGRRQFRQYFTAHLAVPADGDFNRLDRSHRAHQS